MAFVLLITIVVIAVIATGALRPRRRHAGYETERFHRAAHLTSQWARNGVTSPLVTTDDTAELRPRESADR